LLVSGVAALIESIFTSPQVELTAGETVSWTTPLRSGDDQEILPTHPIPQVITSIEHHRTHHRIAERAAPNLEACELRIWLVDYISRCEVRIAALSTNLSLFNELAKNQRSSCQTLRRSQSSRVTVSLAQRAINQSYC